MLRLARGSLGWLLAPPLVAALLAALGHRTGDVAWYWIAMGALAVFVFFLSFFRDPHRPVADGVASPADGTVRLIDQVTDNDLGATDRLSIFMSPRDVHVNRMPLAGTVISVLHHDGGHVPAFKKDSDRNERVEMVLDTAAGRMKVVLIAGTVARRIVPYVKEGMPLSKAQRIALIRFGSRCDLYTPQGRIKWSVKPGQHILAGATKVGEWE